MRKQLLVAVALLGLAAWFFWPTKDVSGQAPTGPITHGAVVGAAPSGPATSEPHQALAHRAAREIHDLRQPPCRIPRAMPVFSATPTPRASRRGSNRSSIWSQGCPLGSCPAGGITARPTATATPRSARRAPTLTPAAAVWVGGNFWDGRAFDTSIQAQGPPINPNEMNNTPVGTAPNQYPPLLVKKLMHRPYTPLIKKIYGKDVFKKYTPRQIFEIWGEAIAAYEACGEVCQFSSKYDASIFGVPAKNKYTLSASEERGRLLYFGGAQCFACHSSAGMPAVMLETDGKETFTMYCFANIGVPKNPGNPYYAMTDPISNPTGYNPLGRTTSTTASAQTPSGHSMGPSSSTPTRATSSSSEGSC